MDIRGARRFAVVRVFVFLVFLGVAFCLFRFTTWGRSITPGSIVQHLEGAHPVVARLTYITVYTVGTVLVLPGTLLSFVGAVLFGAYEGTLYTWIGASLGSILAFLTARWLGRGFVEQLCGKRLGELNRFVEKHGFWGLLMLRLLPIIPFNLINFGSGFTGIRLRDYVAATMLGILPGTFVYQLLFAKVGQRAVAEGIQFKDFRDPELLWPIGLFVSFVLIGAFLARRIKGSRQAEENE